ncbi:CDP-glucose 4,6-dehydratase [Cohnella sp. LGH]|uniref:CDP-glucose 4,6-dehydratase n=1 Tax=Cohnella sp. LGH TaxID=1619153 RepID=UPI001ADBC751|nr:CDP-glucose 4,6-dehydratase [Cohnella sp. LGH]QTH46871.1 CDP-glucose 4,6-dehydratase [Cohnella sp. LGH]
MGIIDTTFWKGKNVLITGNTGFKGSWLSLWLTRLGANVTGYSLKPPTTPSLFELTGNHKLYETYFEDIRDREKLRNAVQLVKPEIVFHMAAQPLVRASYKDPVETFTTNVLGTVYLHEALREYNGAKVFINVTTDKCYENKEWLWGYRENEPLGGHDPYSSSKACSELVTASYRSSFYDQENSGMQIASARAGNVIGGGDWAEDRLIPDCVRSLLNNEKIIIRNPHAIRPWQHVLEPLSGYMVLAQKLYMEGKTYAQAWNFGPDDEDAKPVKWIVEQLTEKWTDNQGFELNHADHPHEAHYLKLDCSKAKYMLNWRPRWSLSAAIDKIIDWNIEYKNGQNVHSICSKQIDVYMKSL